MQERMSSICVQVGIRLYIVRFVDGCFRRILVAVAMVDGRTAVERDVSRISSVVSHRVKSELL